jgi:hypothetical protein
LAHSKAPFFLPEIPAAPSRNARAVLFFNSFCPAYELSLCGHEYAAQSTDPFFANFCTPAIFCLEQHKRRNVVHNHCSGSNHVTLLRNKAEDFTVL